MEEQMTIQTEVSPVLQVVKERNNNSDVITLSTGYKAKINVVAATLIDDVISLIKDPPVPMWRNEEKDRDEPNPGHPDYLKLLGETEHKRNTAAMDTMIMFGVDLIDGVPEDDKWIGKLKMMVKRGMLDLSAYELTDKDDKEFLFKRYIAVGVEDLGLISAKSGITSNDVKKAEDSFRS